MSVATEIDRYQRQLEEAETALAAQQTHGDDGLTRAVNTAKDAAATMRRRLDQRVGMAMVGRVSSGKSMLIGTLLGNPNLLPAGDLATTGNVTVLRLVQGEPGSATMALADPVVDFLDRDELVKLAEHLRDALIAAASPESMGTAVKTALRAKEPIADEFAAIDGWLRVNWPGGGVEGAEQEPALATMIRQVLALRDAVRSGQMLIGSDPLRLRTEPGPLLKLPPAVPLPKAFPEYAGGPLDRAAVERDERNQQLLFPLFRHVAYEVSVPPKVWPLDGFSGEKQVVLLDFPGLGGRAAPIRDEFLCGKELADVPTVAVCTPASDMAGNEIHKIHQVLHRHGRSADELSRTLFLIATKFDSIGVPQGDDAAKPFATLGNLKQLEEDRITFVRGRHDQIAMVSSFQGIRADVLAEPNSTDVRTSYARFIRSASMLSDWSRFADGLGMDDAAWRTLLEAVIEDGGMKRLRTRLADHAVERGNEVKLERAKSDFRELSTALKAVARAERQFDWKESEDAARKVNTFLRDMHRAVSSMSARVGALYSSEEIADELVDLAVRKVYSWSTWHVVLERVIGHVVPRSTVSPDGDGDPEADRTDALQEQFDALVAELCNEAAYRLHDHSVAWREATDVEIAPLRALWDDDMFQRDVGGLLRRAYERKPDKVELAERKIERAMDATLLENVFNQALRDLAETVPEANRFPLRAKHLQPWAARAPEVPDDRVARHRTAVLRMRVNIATAAAETMREHLRCTTTQLVAAVKEHVEDVRKYVPGDVPARPRRTFDPGHREDTESKSVEEGPVSILLKKWSTAR